MPGVRDLVNRVLEGNTAAAEEALRRALINPHNVLACLELAAKLNREIGSGAEGGLTPLVLVGDVDLEGYRKVARAVGRRRQPDDDAGD